MERYHGALGAAGGGVLPIVISGAGAPTDLATRAARCAFAVRDALGGAPVALCAGLVEEVRRAAGGELLARAERLLEAASARGASSPVHVDEVSAGLLAARFDVRQEGATLALHHEIEEIDAGRRLHGRPSVCLGREREIALLEALFACSVEDSAANVALITGEAGVGKSRLRHELLRRLRARGQRFEAWVAHGDPMSTRSPFAVLARAVRHAAQITHDDPIEVRRNRIRRLAARLPEPARATVFLAELAGAPFEAGASVELAAAREDPLLMGDQIRGAAEDLIRAVASEAPLVLVLDDLQWGDLPTVTFIDAAVRNLVDLPFLVLALARPEVTEIFPRLWVDRATQVVRLPPLPRRAAEGLVKLSLGDTAPPELVNALVEKSGGNAFYLEELTRAVVSGEGAELPETVLAMAQARLDGLGSELRRVLRAASVFGRAFTPEGVEALLGGDGAGVEVVACITELCAAEILVRREDGTLPGGASYGFAQALMREAAYALLTAEDRALGHRLAGGFLFDRGFSDATALAEHFERGGEPARAVAFYRRAAEEALSGNDLATALERAARCAACGAAEGDLGALRLVEAEAYLWRGDIARSEASAAEAAALLAPGSAAWFRAMEHAVVAAEKLGDAHRAISLADAAVARDPAPGARSAKVRCLGGSAASAMILGRFEVADALLARVGEVAAAEVAASDPLDPHGRAAVHQARAFRALHGGDLGAALGDFEAAVAAFGEAGDRRHGCSVRHNLAYVLIELGGYAEAERALRAALVETDRLGLAELRAGILQNLGYTLSQAGQLDEARGLEERAVEAFAKLGNPRMEGYCHAYLARIHLAAGELDAAVREASAVARVPAAAPTLRATAAALHARVLLALGRVDEGLAAAGEAHALLVAAGGGLEEGESLVRLVYAEALAAAGREAEAREAREAAKERLLARAARITSPAWRERFLTQVPDNAATLAGAPGREAEAREAPP